MDALGDMDGFRVLKAKFLSINQIEKLVFGLRPRVRCREVFSLNPIDPSVGRKNGKTFSW